MPTIITHTTRYAPWEEHQDEPIKLGTDTDTWPVEVEPWEAEDGATVVTAAVDILRTEIYATEPSDSEFRPGTWYSAETYESPYTGVREEVTAHLEGFTDDEERAIHSAVTRARMVWDPNAHVPRTDCEMGNACQISYHLGAWVPA